MQKATILSILLPTIALSALPSAAQSSALCPADLKPAIDRITAAPEFERAIWGISIVPLTTDRPNPLYQHNAKQRLIPASNAKLLTTAAALKALPTDFKVQTQIYDLGNDRYLLHGQGDPSLTQTQFDALVRQLKQAGIQTIQELMFDSQYFGLETIPPDWAWEDIHVDYAPPVTGLIFEQNAIAFTLTPTQVGQPLVYQWKQSADADRYPVENYTKTVEPEQPEFIKIVQPRPGTVQLFGQLRAGAEPEEFGIADQSFDRFRDRFITTLTKVGITVKSHRSQNTAIDPPSTKPIAAVDSPPLSEWIQEINQFSNNLYAEALLRQLATRDHSQPPYSRELGLIALKDKLTQLGISPESYQLVDGSGLSRRNWVSAESLVNTLQIMKDDRIFRQSLPVNGQRGSLRHRFKNLPAIVQGKTGFLTGAVSLSGYVSPPNYSPIAFSILLNHATIENSDQIKAIDTIVELLAKLKPC